MTPRRRTVALALGGVALALALAALVRMQSAGRFRTFTGEAMATRWEVVLPERPGAAEAANACFDRFRALDLELSEWKEGSPLSAVNRAAGEGAVAVPPELF